MDFQSLILWSGLGAVAFTILASLCSTAQQRKRISSKPDPIESSSGNLVMSLDWWESVSPSPITIQPVFRKTEKVEDIPCPEYRAVYLLWLLKRWPIQDQEYQAVFNLQGIDSRKALWVQTTIRSVWGIQRQWEELPFDLSDAPNFTTQDSYMIPVTSMLNREDSWQNIAYPEPVVGGWCVLCNNNSQFHYLKSEEQYACHICGFKLSLFAVSTLLAAPLE